VRVNRPVRLVTWHYCLGPHTLVIGNLIIAKESGILLDESGNKQLVDIDDIIFVNYDYAFVIKSNELNKAISEQIAKRIKRDEDNKLYSASCDCEAKTPSN